MGEDARRQFHEELQRLVIARADLSRQRAWDTAVSQVRVRQDRADTRIRITPIKHSTVQDWLHGPHLPRTWEALRNVVRVAEGHAMRRALSISELDLLSDKWKPLYERARAEQEAEADADAGHDQNFARVNYVVKRFAAPKPPPIEELREKAPSELLDTRQEVVGFTGRRHEQDGLAQWRDGKTDGGRAVQLLWGPGGQGKTRLATKWAADSAAQGWDVLTAEHGAATGGGLGDPKQIGPAVVSSEKTTLPAVSAARDGSHELVAWRV